MTYIYGLQGIESGISNIASAITKGANALDKIAKAIESKQTPNIYNVYVTTSDTVTTGDVAAAVQEAIKRVDHVRRA